MICNYVVNPALGETCSDRGVAAIGSSGAGSAFIRCSEHVPPTIVAIAQRGWTFSIRLLLDAAPLLDDVLSVADTMTDLVNDAYADIMQGDFTMEHDANGQMILTPERPYNAPSGDHFAYPDVGYEMGPG